MANDQPLSAPANPSPGGPAGAPPPDPEKIKALLQMAEMRSSWGAAAAKTPYRTVFIVLGITVAVIIAAYLLLMWTTRGS